MKTTRLKRKSKQRERILMNRAVATFNRWIRERDRVKLKGHCYTCGSLNGAEAGHWKHSNNSLRFEERAVHLQCTRCNKWLSGNLAVYTLKLIEEYGLDTVKQLNKQATELKQFTEQELEQIISKYK